MSERVTKPFSFKILNLKLIIEGETTEAKYQELIERWLRNSQKIYTSKDIFGKIKSFEKLEFNEGVCYAGTIVKAKESDQTYEFDDENNPILIENNENHFTNPILGEFIFVPKAHRFAFIEGRRIDIKWFKAFVNNSIQPILVNDESIELSIKTSEEFIEDYIRNRPIRKIKIQMSYSNSDSFDEIAMAAMEQNMRDTHTRKLTVVAESDKNGDIDVIDNDILNPMAGIALDNGTISVWDRENRTSIPSITTKAVPESFSIESSEYAIKKDIFKKIIDIFRSPTN